MRPFIAAVFLRPVGCNLNHCELFGKVKFSKNKALNFKKDL